MASFYGMTFYNASNSTEEILKEVTVEEESNITALSIAAAIFVTGMTIATMTFCIRQRMLRKPAFDEI